MKRRRLAALVISLLGCVGSAQAADLYFGPTPGGGAGGRYAPADAFAYDRAFGYSKPYALDRHYGYGQPVRQLPEAKFTPADALEAPAPGLRAAIRASEALDALEAPPPPRRKPESRLSAAGEMFPAVPKPTTESH